MPKLEAAKTTQKRAPPSVASGASTSAVVRRGPHESSASEAYSDGEEVAGASSVQWVCCDKCSRWRKLSGLTDLKSLPKRWFCKVRRARVHAATA